MWLTIVEYLHDCTSTFALCLAVLLVGYVYIRSLYTYWERRGIDSPIRSSFPLGTFGKLFLQKCTCGELMQYFYYSSTKPLIGVYAGIRPMVIPRDPELIQRILVKDHQYFYDRGWYSNPAVDPLTDNLLLASGEDWRRMRQLVIPAFTISKLKAMMPVIVESTHSLQQFVANHADQDASLEMYNVAVRYTINTIAATAFGIDIDCLANPADEFLVQGRKFFQQTVKHGLRQFLMFVSPRAMKFMKMRLFDREVAEFMIDMVTENLRLRETERVVRKDFFQLLVQIRNGGSVGMNDDWSARINGDANRKLLSIEEVAAQAYIFFMAGHETSAGLISFCLYEMACNRNIQAKLHKEIDEVLAKHNGQMTWESVAEMKFLDCCVDETLRKYPPLPALNRECTKDYEVPGTGVVIEKGTPVMIPVWALHYDEQFWSEPQQFRPERFAVENRKNFVEQPCLLFGDGPRGCIAGQLGKTQSKAALVTLLRAYEFELGAEMLNRKLEIAKHQITPAAVGGINLRIRKRV